MCGMAPPRRERALSIWAVPLVRASPFQIQTNSMLMEWSKAEVKDRTRGTARNETRSLRRGRAVASHREAKPH
jgi:hypothetical protein